MASSGFPQRKSSGAGGMTAEDSSPLDSAPPSPMAPNGMQLPGGQISPQSLGGPGGLPSTPGMMSEVAQPLTAGSPGQVLTPDIAMGLMSTAQTMYSSFDAMASIVPDLANDFAMMKVLLQDTMAKVVLKSGATASVASAGNGFPGGGFASGGM